MTGNATIETPHSKHSKKKVRAFGLGPVTNASAVTTSYRYYVLFIMYLVYTINYLDRQILAILIEPIKNDLHLSDTQLGFLSGLAFALFYVTLGVPIARMADRRSRRDIVGVALVIWSVMTVLCGMAANFWQLTLARFGVAVGESGCIAPAQSVLADYFPEHMRARVLSIFSSGIYMGTLLGFLLGGWVTEFYNWRTAFVAAGVPGLLLALVLFATVREPVRGMSDSGLPNLSPNKFLQDMKILLKRRTFLAVAVAAGLNSLTGYGLSTWLPAFYLRIHHLSPGEVGTNLALIIGIFGSLGAVLGGVLADRLAHRDRRWYLWLCCLSGVASAPIALLFLVVENTTLSFGLLALAIANGAIFNGPVYAVILGVSGSSLRATGVAGVLFISNFLGIGLGSLFVGAVSDLYASFGSAESLRYSMLTVLVFGFAGVFGMYIAAKTLNEDWQS